MFESKYEAGAAAAVVAAAASRRSPGIPNGSSLRSGGSGVLRWGSGLSAGGTGGSGSLMAAAAGSGPSALGSPHGASLPLPVPPVYDASWSLLAITFDHLADDIDIGYGIWHDGTSPLRAVTRIVKDYSPDAYHAGRLRPATK